MAPNGLAVSKDGWIATADGFIIDDTIKYDFITLVNSYSEILENINGDPCDVRTFGCDQLTQYIQSQELALQNTEYCQSI